MSWALCHVLRLRLFSSLPVTTTHADATLTSLLSKSQLSRRLHQLQSQRWRRIHYTLKKPHLRHLHQNNNSSSSASTSSSNCSTKCQPFSSSTLLITEEAKKRLKNLFSSSEENTDSSYLRICVEGGGCSGFQYKFEMDSKKIDDTEDIVLSSGEEGDKGRVVIDKPSLDILKGSTIDYQQELIRSAFRIIDIPAAGDGCSCGASFTIKID